MSIDKSSLKKIAKSVCLEITDEQIDNLDLISVIEWAGEISRVDTKNIEPMYHIPTHAMIFRDDVANTGGIQKTILANSPDKTGVNAGYFAVPKMIGGEE